MNYLTRTTCFRGVHGLIIVPFYDILTVQTCECVAQFCEWIPIYWGNVPSVYRGGSRGRVPRVRTPPPLPEMTCGFLYNTTGILQKNKKKTMWFIGVEVEQDTSASPPKKNRGSAPGLIETADFIQGSGVNGGSVASSSAPSSTSNTLPRTEDNNSISSGSCGSHCAVPNTATSVWKLGLNR